MSDLPLKYVFIRTIFFFFLSAETIMKINYSLLMDYLGLLILFIGKFYVLYSHLYPYRISYYAYIFSPLKLRFATAIHNIRRLTPLAHSIRLGFETH